MPLLLGPHDHEILGIIKILLAEEDLLSPKMLSSLLVREDIDMTPAQCGWWIRKTKAFRKRRRGAGAFWVPIRPRLQHLYKQLNLQ